MYSKNKFSNWKAADYFLAILLTFIIAIIPLIVTVVQVPAGIDEITYTRTSYFVLDSFSYYKSIFLITACSLISVFFVSNLITSENNVQFKKLLSHPISIATFVFMFMTLLTFIFSKYKYTNIHGYSERYESIFILFSYFIIFFTVIYFVTDLFKVNIILYGLLFSSYVISFIGISQMMGNDFFLTEFGSNLILGDKSNGVTLSSTFKNPTTNVTKVYGTLFNPNCVGLYTSLMIPLTFISGVFCKNNLKLRCLLLISSFLNLVILIGSGSVGGFFAIIVSSIFTVVVILILLKFKVVRIIPIFVVSVVVMFFIPPINKQFKVVINKFTSYGEISNGFIFNDIKESNGDIELYYRDDFLKISYDKINQKILLLDKNGVDILPVSTGETEIISSGKRVNFNIPNLGETSIEIGNSFFSLKNRDIHFMFTVDPDGNIIPFSKMGDPIDLNKPIEKIGFEGKELFASSRGYIWSRSLPLLKNTIILGAGVDSYAFIFPQNDIVGKLNYFGNPYITVDKPHNLYLQTALNTGIVSLLALLFIFGFYIVNTLKLIFCSESKNNFIFGLRFASLIAIFSYLVSALTTDSVVSVSPVFWAVLGLAFAVNKIREL